MSEPDKDTLPISTDSPLGKALDAFEVPPLPDGFADRIVMATHDRVAPLPLPRKPNGRWRSARRLAIGALAAGALGTAAAATGVFKELGVNLPTAAEVWSSISGSDSEPAQDVPTSNETSVQAVPTPVEIEGPIDSPEELEEAFRRVDEVRAERKATRRDRVDQRIDRVIDRRREQGLPAPTPEEEARLRKRIEQLRENRDQRIEERLGERREELRERVESGEELTREDFVAPQRTGQGEKRGGNRLRRLREMPPEQRREAIRRFRERRQQRTENSSDMSADVETDVSDAPMELPE
ncbi:hypothetical protein [Erythrobacter sp. THAF29]|uniref:hypothetical protein n=1 Tax=Erythrobacter sp. THAF29 TaxID=2587851 RepID=UPI0012695E0D|nr:hypothetical protein [Erythrobacter sp. THAF29]QFT77398.1 hypothetical protein FIU90_07575 [Erythrobacter sp. THAF29]